MKIVIQCAGSKEPSGTFKLDGRPVSFVARPHSAPRNESLIWANPDDLVMPAVPDLTWRDQLTRCNVGWEHRHLNKEQFVPAYQLYTPGVYRELVNRFGAANVFILSAGWGLVRSTFLLPDYDITLASMSKEEKFKQRDKCLVGGWKDYAHLVLSEPAEEVIFIGGKSYWELFRKLCPAEASPVIYHAGDPPKMSQIPAPSRARLVQFGRPFTNWHYVCAKEIVTAGGPRL
jgi:hypothetical protein